MTIPGIGEVPNEYFSGGSHLTDTQLSAMLNSMGRATRIVHEPIASSNRSRSQPSAGPDPLAIGPVLVSEFTGPSDALYSEYRVPDTHDGVYSALHVHWTKSGDAVESGNTVRWHIEVLQFSDEEDNDLTRAPTVLEFDDTYDDDGTTSRILYRTSDIAIPGGLIPGHYLGVRVSLDASGTTLSSNPALVSADLRLSKEINR